jgi:hypothetical protein
MKCRFLWLAAPIVAGHAGCIAFPATAIALGLPAVMPICGSGLGPLLPALATMGLHLAATLGLAGAVAMLLDCMSGPGWIRTNDQGIMSPLL